LSISISQLKNISFVIHAWPLATYAGSVDMPLKHLGFAKWPTIKGSNLCVPVELQLLLIFHCFPCHQHTFLLLFGSIW
jgi:hypothetical protein